MDSKLIKKRGDSISTSKVKLGNSRRSTEKKQAFRSKLTSKFIDQEDISITSSSSSEDRSGILVREMFDIAEESKNSDESSEVK